MRGELDSGAAACFLLYCRIDPYGFERPEDFDYAAYEEFFSTYLVILTRRAIKWSKLLKGSGSVQKSMRGEFGTWTWPTNHSATRPLADKCFGGRGVQGSLGTPIQGGCLESCIFARDLEIGK